MRDTEGGLRTWHVDAGRFEYRLGYSDGSLLHLGFGPEPDEDPWGTLPAGPPFTDLVRERFSEVGYAVEGEDRWNELDLHGDLASGPTGTAGSSLTISLTDRRWPLDLELHYTADPELGLVTRWQRVRNVGSSTIAITEWPSFRIRCPVGVHRLDSLHGSGNDECRFQSSLLPVGTTILESRSGKTGFEHAPWFALGHGSFTTFAQLRYSGNWRIRFDKDALGGVTVTGGVSPWAFRYLLAPGGSLDSPAVILGATAGDGNAVSRSLHAYQRKSVIPPRPSPPPVQFNSWYAAPGNTPIGRMKELASLSAPLGCEVFVLDAGWYRNVDAPPGTGWEEQLGDWTANEELFPGGVGALAEHVRGLGMGFGIWMEPECVSSTARVFRDHPEWLHANRGTPISVGGRYVLQLGRPDVREWVLGQVTRVVRETGAEWLKWDFNAHAHVFAGGDPKGSGDPLMDHVLGLYQVWDAVREEFPRLVLEGCSGGGGRMDAGSMGHTHVTWMSDMVSSVNALGIRFGSSHAYAARAVNHWLVHWPHDWPWWEGVQPGLGDLDFRTRVAMMGSFGIGAPLDRWSEADLERLHHHVKIYKDLRHLICDGNEVRLTPDPPRDGTGSWAAMLFVAQDGSEAALFAFRLRSTSLHRTFRVPDLWPDTRYVVTDDADELVIETTGRALAGLGIEVSLPRRFTSTLLKVRPA